jgi:hypothetical protein
MVTLLLISGSALILGRQIQIISNPLLLTNPIKWIEKLKNLFKSPFFPAFLLLAMWLALSGIGGVGHQNRDYITAHNALLKDLILQEWPIRLKTTSINTPYVYYIAYYLPAGLVGKVLTSWKAANLAMFIWAGFGVYLAFGWFIKISRVNINRKVLPVFILACFFCFASGMDTVGYYLLQKHPFQFTQHIEFWADLFQFSSQTTLLYWVPQHTIAAWLLIGLIVNSLENQEYVKYLGIAAAATLLWSPFGVLGSIAYFFLTIYRYFSRYQSLRVIEFQSIFLTIAALWFFLITASFLASNSFDYPITFTVKELAPIKDYIIRLIEFWLIEFALLTILVIGYLCISKNPTTNYGAQVPRNSQVGRSISGISTNVDIKTTQFYLFSIAFSTLLALPLFKIGYNNDLVMRASIPSLFIFWSFVAKVVIDPSKHYRVLNRLFYVFIILLLLIGSYTSISEILRSVKLYQISPPPIEIVTDNQRTEKLIQRAGMDDAFFFKYFAK